MGTSYVEYRNHGFWSRDAFLESWLKAMLTELEPLSKTEPWLRSLIEHWRVQAEIDGGCMSLGLDEFIGDGARRDLILLAARRAKAQRTDVNERTSDLFIALLSGELSTNTSSPIDYF